MTIGYLPVPGTWGEQRAGVQWFQIGSPLDKFLDARGLVNLCANAVTPYSWSTSLDFTTGDHYDWAAGGQALFYYLVPQFDPTQQPFPPSETVIISHSHGLQVVAYACALGLKVDRFIDVCGPVRADMMETYRKARSNIRQWLHVYSDWRDHMQWFGELFDGQFGIVRKHPLADVNVGIPKVGHSGLLYDASYFPLWQSDGLIDFLRAAQPEPVHAA